MESMLLVVGFLLLISGSVQGVTNVDDITTLSFLRSYWNLDSLAGWPDPNLVDPCENELMFPGITCFQPYLVQFVRILTLEALAINSDIPVEVVDFPLLSELRVVNCGMSGTFPEFITTMPELAYLDLTANSFTGTIPDLSNMQNFLQITTTSNQITGSLPEVGPNLQLMQLGNNMLSGEIPTSYESTAFVELILSANNMTGLIPNLNTTRFSILGLNDNQFFGFLSDTFLATPPPFTAILNRNQFACPNPAWCTAIFCMDCYPPGTNLGDEMVMATLDAAWGAGWTLADDPCNIPTSYPTITCNERNPIDKRITSIEVSGRGLSGIIPAAIQNLDFLLSLNASANQLNGPIPSELGNMVALETLDLSSNQFTGNLIQFPTSPIRTINFRNNMLQGPLLPEYGALNSLEFLDLSTNMFTGEIPTSYNATTLLYLGLENNNLQGTVPSTLGNMTSLQTLLLGNNNLNGTLPEQLGNPSNRVVYLNDNQFTGTIPSSFEGNHLDDFSVNGNLMSIDLKLTFWNIQPPFMYDLRNNRWDCDLPQHCQLNAPGNGLCVPCIPSMSPTVSFSNTPSVSHSSTISISPSPCPSPSLSSTTSLTTTASFSPTASSSSSVSASATASSRASPSPSPTRTETVTLTPNPCPRNEILDDCGVCNGNNADKDNCGVCFGNNDCLLVTDGPFNWTESCHKFHFNEATDRGKMNIFNYDCRNILRSSTIRKLGVSGYCYWESDCVVYLCEGSESTLNANDTIDFLPVIHSITTGETLGRTRTYLYSITRAPKPTAIINGPQEHHPCDGDEILLDGSYSLSNIARSSLSYSWEYVPMEDSDSRREVISGITAALEHATNINSPLVYLETRTWLVNSHYHFRLTVTNIGGVSSTSEIYSVHTVARAIPQIRIVGPSRISRFDVTTSIEFHSMFIYSSCIFDYTFSPLYHWQVISTRNGQMLHTHVDFQSSTLVIPPYTFPADEQGSEYNITLHASDGISSTSHTITITTKHGKICAIISKGNRRVMLSDLELDGSETEDTMNSNVPFHWEWDCWTLDSARTDENCNAVRLPCIQPNGEEFILPNTEKLVVPREWLTFGNYYFSLTASKGTRSGYDEVVISVVPETSSWNAWINAPCNYLHGQTLVLEGHCDDGDLTDDDEDHLDSYEWRATFPINGTSSSTLSASKNLVIQPFMSSGLQSYPNSVTLICNNEQFAEYNFPTSNLPLPGNFQIFPESGIACVDQFDLIASGWASGTKDGENTLFYQFSYLNENKQQVYLNEPKSMSNRIRLVLPQGNQAGSSLTLLLTVRDQFGAAQQLSKTIQVFPRPQEQEQGQITRTLIFDSFIITKRAILQNQQVEANAMLNCLANEDLQSEDIEETLELIDRSLEIRCTSTVVQQIARSLRQISLRAESLTSSHISLILDILSINQYCFMGADDVAFVDATHVISNIFRTPLAEHQVHAARCFIEIMRGIRTMPRICGELLGDILTDNVRIQSQIIFTKAVIDDDTDENRFLNFQFENDENSFVSISHSSFRESASAFASCIVGDFTVYSVDPFHVEDSDLQSVTNSMVFHNLGSEEEIPFEGLDIPIEVSLQRVQKGSRTNDLSCAFYSKGKYKDSGLKLRIADENRFVCSTEHLTDFSVLLGSNIDDSSSQGFQNNVILILSAIAIVVALCCMIIVVVLLSKFPTLRHMILNGETPGKAKRRNQRRINRAKQKTLRQYGVNAET